MSALRRRLSGARKELHTTVEKGKYRDALYAQADFGEGCGTRRSRREEDEMEREKGKSKKREEHKTHTRTYTRTSPTNNPHTKPHHTHTDTCRPTVSRLPASSQRACAPGARTLSSNARLQGIRENTTVREPDMLAACSCSRRHVAYADGIEVLLVVLVARVVLEGLKRGNAEEKGRAR